MLKETSCFLSSVLRFRSILFACRCRVVILLQAQPTICLSIPLVATAPPLFRFGMGI